MLHCLLLHPRLMAQSAYCGIRACWRICAPSTHPSHYQETRKLLSGKPMTALTHGDVAAVCRAVVPPTRVLKARNAYNQVCAGSGWRWRGRWAWGTGFRASESNVCRKTCMQGHLCVSFLCMCCAAVACRSIPSNNCRLLSPQKVGADPHGENRRAP